MLLIAAILMLITSTLTVRHGIKTGKYGQPFKHDLYKAMTILSIVGAAFMLLCSTVSIPIMIHGKKEIELKIKSTDIAIKEMRDANTKVSGMGIQLETAYVQKATHDLIVKRSELIAELAAHNYNMCLSFFMNCE